MDDESGVDLVRLVRQVEPHGVGVAAKPVRGFEEGHLVRRCQQPRRRHPGDATANDRDPHNKPFVRHAPFGCIEPRVVSTGAT